MSALNLTEKDHLPASEKTLQCSSVMTHRSVITSMLLGRALFQPEFIAKTGATKFTQRSSVAVHLILSIA